MRYIYSTSIFLARVTLALLFQQNGNPTTTRQHSARCPNPSRGPEQVHGQPGWHEIDRATVIFERAGRHSDNGRPIEMIVAVSDRAISPARRLMGCGHPVGIYWMRRPSLPKKWR